MPVIKAAFDLDQHKLGNGLTLQRNQRKAKHLLDRNSITLRSVVHGWRCNRGVLARFRRKDEDLAGINTIWIPDPVSVRFVHDGVSRAHAVGDTADAP